HLGFVESIEQLASRAGLTVPTTQKFTIEQKDKHDNLFALMERISHYYRHQLKHHPQKQIAIDYLRNRGLTGEICQQFGIGLAPPGRDNVYRYFLENKDQLVAAGMLSEKTAQQYQDRFRNRIMFPIRDRQGRVIAFGGRVLDDATPKYLNSPETTIFHKSQELYGLYEVMQHSTTKLDKLLVVEGYLDVVALAQFNINYAVATLGTALNVQHLRRLFRLVNQVIFCFDGDAAGQRAAWRALEQSLAMATDEREIYFLILPEGDDPDSYVRRVGTEGFTQALAKAQPLTTFLLQHLRAQVNLNNLDGKAKLIKLAQPLIQELPDGARKLLLWEQLSVITGLNPKEIKKLCGNHKTTKSENQKNTHVKLGTSLTSIQRLLSLLLQYPELAAHIPADYPWPEEADSDLILVKELLAFLQDKSNIHTGILLEHWRTSEYAAYLVSLAAWELVLNSQQLTEEVAGLLEKVSAEELDKQILLLHQKVAQFGLEGLTPEEKTWLQNWSRQ
ncbi:MAG: DNA primase, partial [Gammaproteobacteria bacterium]